MNKKILLITLACLLYCCILPSQAFIKITDLVFDGMSVDPDEFDVTLELIKENKRKNKTNEAKGKVKRFPTKLTTITARQVNPKNIQLEVDTSEVVAKTAKDIQGAISNVNFLNAISEAISLWEGVMIADVDFAPLKFASGQPNPDDGRNVITFRAVEGIEGAPEGTPIFTIVTYARSKQVEFMGKNIKVKPGTILDADIVYDPTNDPCLALHTTEGDFKIGGDDIAIADGGINPNADLSNCTFISAGDVTDLAVRSIAHILGLESSAIASAGSASVGQIMTRYSLTSDDEIGLANIYPNKATLTNHGSLNSKVTLNKKPVTGAHIVLENTTTGEPTVGGITDTKGKFEINSIPAGSYNVYVEPLDGPIRKAGLGFSFLGFNANLNFTTTVLPDPITITANKKTRINNIEVKELSASAFNINHLTVALTEEDVNASSGAFILPIRIMSGETLTDIDFWGSNINPEFGTLSVSGTGITVSNVRENKSIPISPFFTCAECEDTPTSMCSRDPRCDVTEEIDEEPDELPGITVDITCTAGTPPGPRNIIFTGDVLDPENPSFGLRDQISGGIIVTED
ncbi:MAG: carboxypeptidase regulatory-like domain-containing protein [Candidatus Melainabacteria bacterium]|nr:carboxypeptidase regulatory-like domain-containing protein [Candidatus Melainabacteria bacterium]